MVKGCILGEREGCKKDIFWDGRMLAKAAGQCLGCQMNHVPSVAWRLAGSRRFSSPMHMKQAACMPFAQSGMKRYAQGHWPKGRWQVSGCYQAKLASKRWAAYSCETYSCFPHQHGLQLRVLQDPSRYPQKLFGTIRACQQFNRRSGSALAVLLIVYWSPELSDVALQMRRTRCIGLRQLSLSLRARTPPACWLK